MTPLTGHGAMNAPLKCSTPTPGASLLEGVHVGAASDRLLVEAEGVREDLLALRKAGRPATHTPGLGSSRRLQSAPGLDEPFVSQSRVGVQSPARGLRDTRQWSSSPSNEG
jgi:hypothetical protein